MLKFFCCLCSITLFLLQAGYPQTLKLTLEWLLNPHHAPLVVAITQGYFAEEGLSVELIQAQGSLEGCIQVAAGTADLALTNEAQWVIQQDKGLVLEPVMTLIAEPLEVFVSSVPLGQLRGKRIGHASSGVGFSAAVLKHILLNQGLTEKDIMAVHTKHGLVAALLSGQVEAIINAYRTYATLDLKGHGQAYYMYPYESLGIPVFAAQIMVANPKVSAATRQALRRALTKACDFLKDDPARAWHIFKTTYPEMDTVNNKLIWPSVAALFKVDPFPANTENHQKLKTFLKLYQLTQ